MGVDYPFPIVEESEARQAGVAKVHAVRAQPDEKAVVPRSIPCTAAERKPAHVAHTGLLARGSASRPAKEPALFNRRSSDDGSDPDAV